MVPLQDRNPTTRTAYVTYALVLINILVFVYELTLSPQELAAFFREWAVVPAELTASFRGGGHLFAAPRMGNAIYLAIFARGLFASWRQHALFVGFRQQC